MARTMPPLGWSTDLAHVYAKHVPEHAPTTIRASGYRNVATSGCSAATFGPSRRLPTCLSRHVRCWWSRRCTDSRPTATSPLRGVASLHAVIFVVPAHRRPRLLPRRLPRRGSPTSAHGLLTPGSSSPTSSTAAALSQVTCMATLAGAGLVDHPYDSLGV
jgi:hypothetical protein